MTDLKRELRLILNRHEGRGKAITSRELSLLTGEPERKVRLVIRELRAEHFPVLSATDFPAGYFMPLTKEEVDACLAQNKSRLIEDAKVIKDIKVGAALWLAPAVQAKML